MVTMTSSTHLLAWLSEHSVTILFVSVVTAVVVDIAVRARRSTGFDLRGAAVSVAAGAAYISAKGIVSKGLMFVVAMWVHRHHRLLDLDATAPLVWLAMFLCRDFVYYWIHRAEHRVAGLWASHMIHHSSEEFTFTTAVRMPWMEALYKPVLGLWAPLIGFHPVSFAAMGALVLVVGQFQHTELLRRRTWLDRWFVTPSAHRVHHGSNPEYIDKNFGSMLIVWDRIFGTYEPEVAPVRYGLVGSGQVRTVADALVGGYPMLFEAKAGRGLRHRVAALVARPGGARA